MLLHQARAATRTSPEGDLVRLEDQDRSRWDRALIAEGVALVEEALGSRRFGPYALQAAIAAVHAEAATPEATDWAQIAGLYDVLLRVEPSPVVELNRAVAVAMRDGPAHGLALVDALLARGELTEFHLAHATRAELCRRLRRVRDAVAAYDEALRLVKQEPERRFLERRRAELVGGGPPDAGAVVVAMHHAPAQGRKGLFAHGVSAARHGGAAPLEKEVGPRQVVQERFELGALGRIEEVGHLRVEERQAGRQIGAAVRPRHEIAAHRYP
jgi:hypothetical protein